MENKDWSDPSIRLQHYQKERKKAKNRYYGIVAAVTTVMTILFVSLIVVIKGVFNFEQPFLLMVVFCVIGAVISVMAVWQCIKMLKQDKLVMRRKVGKTNFAIRQLLNGKLEEL